MKPLLIAAAAALALAAGSAHGQTDPASAAASAAKLSADSLVTALIDDEKARAVLAKHAPILIDYADQIPEGVTLNQLAQVPEAQAVLGPEVVKAIVADLAAL